MVPRSIPIAGPSTLAIVVSVREEGDANDCALLKCGKVKVSGDFNTINAEARGEETSFRKASATTHHSIFFFFDKNGRLEKVSSFLVWGFSLRQV